MAEKKTIEDVISICQTYLNDSSIALIKKAYDVAYKMHDGQFRKSGDPYIQHPIEVAYILATIHTGPSTICAGLMHDVLEDTSMDKKTMEEEFNKEIADIVDGVTKISKLKYVTKDKALAHNHEKLFMAMAKDIRVIIVKICDRLHNMRTIEFQSPEKQKRIAQETLDLYAPLAHKLGMYRIKAELEDLSFNTIKPDTYKEIYDLIAEKKSQREDDIDVMKKAISDMLVKNNINDFEIKGRIKNIYSIYNKMSSKNKTIDDIFDLLALRVIVPTEADCYHVLGLIHAIWTPIPMRFKDYIAVPKANLYQSLHTTVLGPGGKIFEVQIRTSHMDEVAELGVAAHWAYKENTAYSAEKEQLEITKKLKWYQDFTAYLEENDRPDPLTNIKDDIFGASVFVLTPNGDVYDLPDGSMPLDFAFRIHTEVGTHCVGAIVNGKIVPLSYKLQIGDVVEIKTNKSSAGPSASWLKLTKTSHAKNKIKTFLNKQQHDENVASGLAELEKACQARDYDIKSITDQVAAENFSRFAVKNFEDLCAEIGKPSISANAVLNKLLGLTEVKMDDNLALKQYSEETSSNRIKKNNRNEYGVVVDGLTKAQIKLGNCCQPVYGDKITGYITKGYGIVVHRAGCPNLLEKSERTIDVKWEPGFNDRVFYTSLKTFARDRRNLVADMINILNSCNVSIVSVTSSRNINDECVTKFKLQVASIDELDKTILALNKMPEMYSVERLFK